MDTILTGINEIILDHINHGNKDEINISPGGGTINSEQIIPNECDQFHIKLVFENILFNENANLTFAHSNLNSSLNFINCIIDKLSFNIRLMVKVSFINCTFTSDIAFIGEFRINTIEFIQCIVKTDFNFDKLIQKSYGARIENCIIDSLKYNAQCNCKLDIVESTILELVVTGKCSSIQNLQHITSKSIVFNKFGFIFNANIGEGAFTIEHIIPILGNASIKFSESKLEKVHIKNTDFSKFNFTIDKASSFRGIDLYNTTWPKIRQVIGDNGDIYEFYKDIKAVLEKLGYSLEVLRISAYEQEAFRRNLYKGKRWHPSGDGFILWFNKVSNYYRLSITRPLIWIAIIGIILFWIILYKEGLSFKEYYGYFFVFLNPVHRPDFLVDSVSGKNINPKNLSLILDFIGRILISVMAFQFVSAFRKFIRR